MVEKRDKSTVHDLFHLYYQECGTDVHVGYSSCLLSCFILYLVSMCSSASSLHAMFFYRKTSPYMCSFSLLQCICFEHRILQSLGTQQAVTASPAVKYMYVCLLSSLCLYFLSWPTTKHSILLLD